MKTLSLTVSSFASTSLCIVFIFCLQFCILSHFEIIRALWNYGSLLQHIFCWNRTIKRKLKSCFFWVPLYCSPKRPEYVDDFIFFRIWDNLLVHFATGCTNPTNFYQRTWEIVPRFNLFWGENYSYD